MTLFNNQKILITGGAGAIGTTLTRRLLETEVAEIILLDDLSSSKEWNIPKSGRVKFIKGDILDAGKLDEAFSSRPDYVFHLAAFFANANSIAHPEKDLMTNGMGTLKILQHSHRYGVNRLIYTSSGSSVYTPDRPLPYREEDVSIHLDTPYQITKLLGEMYCHFYSTYYGLDTVRIRLFSSFGPGEIPGRYRNVIPNFIYWALQGKPLPITGTGEETRDFTFVGDIVKGLVSASKAENVLNQEFNFSTGREISINEIASLVNKMTGNKAGVSYVTNRKWDRKRRVRASIEKAEKYLNYAPNTQFEEGLTQTVNWFKENWSYIKRDADFPQATPEEKA